MALLIAHHAGPPPPPPPARYVFTAKQAVQTIPAVTLLLVRRRWKNIRYLFSRLESSFFLFVFLHLRLRPLMVTLVVAIIRMMVGERTNERGNDNSKQKGRWAISFS